jgi:LysR family glycine cleavage system transcriptional activator
VGQQIRALEDLLGVVLFRRTTKGLELTDEAQAGLEPLRAGFLHFEDAVQAMQAGQSAHVFTIAAPRDIFAAWLAPRLASFRAANPDARLVLVDGDATDFTEANLDVALRLAEGPGDLQGVAIGPAEQVVVGEGEWIAWPGDPQPAGEEAEASIHVGDAGQAIGAAAAGLGACACRCCWRRAGANWAASPVSARPSQAVAAIGWWRPRRNGGRRR